MTLPPLLAVPDVRERLSAIFPDGTPNRNYVTREIAAKTVFVMLYIGAVEGAERWLRPDQVTRMTDAQAVLGEDGRTRTLADRLDAIGWGLTSPGDGMPPIRASPSGTKRYGKDWCAWVRWWNGKACPQRRLFPAMHWREEFCRIVRPPFGGEGAGDRD